MSKEDLVGLSPAEKIKKLKEIEQKKKKEIEEAHQLIQESEQELSAEEEWKRKVPIPQVARDDFSDATAEELEMQSAHRGASVQGTALEDELEKKAKQVGESISWKEQEGTETLEQLTGSASRTISGLANTDYAAHLSQQPIDKLRSDVYKIIDTASEKGYFSEDDQRKLEYHIAGIDMKMDAAESGTYKSFSEQVAQEASEVKKLASGALNQPYQGREGKGNRMYQ